MFLHYSDAIAGILAKHRDGFLNRKVSMKYDNEAMLWREVVAREGLHEMTVGITVMFICKYNGWRKMRQINLLKAPTISKHLRSTLFLRMA